MRAGCLGWPAQAANKPAIQVPVQIPLDAPAAPGGPITAAGSAPSGRFWAMISSLSRLIAGLSLAVLAAQPASSETIQLEQQHGIFMVPVRINDVVTIPFVLDSGASVVVITADVLTVLRRAGTVKDSDFRGTGTYTLADGSTRSSDRYVLHKMAVGGHVITDVIATVTPAQGDPLLGQSFLSKLPGWTVDNERHALVLKDKVMASPAPTGDPSRTNLGVLTQPGGGRYEGDIRDGVANGHGTVTYPGGGGEEGQFRDGKLNGHGVVTLPGGTRFKEGQFRDGNLIRGVVTLLDGSRYEGDWRGGELIHGVVTSPNGTRYDCDGASCP